MVELRFGLVVASEIHQYRAKHGGVGREQGVARGSGLTAQRHGLSGERLSFGEPALGVCLPGEVVVDVRPRVGAGVAQ
jgi:hypothetical protein